MRPATLAEVAQRRNGGEELGPLMAEFLDTFYGAVKSKRAQPLLAPEPQHLPSADEHALLGAIGEHLARRWNLIIPEWVNDPSRFLKRPYFTSPLEGFKALLIAESPLAFRRRLIFTEAEPFTPSHNVLGKSAPWFYSVKAGSNPGMMPAKNRIAQNRTGSHNSFS